MYSDNAGGVGGAQARGDTGADIAAMGAVPLIAETMHDLDDSRGDSARGPSRLLRLWRVPEAGDRGHDDVEGIRGIATMGARITERV
jgi:hypothetical protein